MHSDGWDERIAIPERVIAVTGGPRGVMNTTRAMLATVKEPE